MAILDIYSQIVAYSDAAITNNPLQKNVDWQPKVQGISVQNPISKVFSVPPGESVTLFSGTRSTGIDGTTVFSIEYKTAVSRYRITRTAGTVPAFRTNRNLTLNGEEVVVTINNDVIATLALDALSAGAFTGVVVGDIVFLPHTTTGDSASVFNDLNVGFWVVIAAANKLLTLRRRSGESFIGVSETVTLTANSQIQAFSAAGIQIGDTLEITAGFSVVTQKVFEIAELTADWIEFTSGEALPLETGISPGAAGMTFYTDAKRYIRVECNRESVVRFNGDAGNTNKITPWESGNSDLVGWVEKIGVTHTLVVVNKSATDTLTGMLITCE